MRLFPRNPRRLLVLLVVGAVLIGTSYWVHKYRTCMWHLRVKDEAGILLRSDACWLDAALDAAESESGIDIRFAFVKDLKGESLEQYGLRRARELGLGQTTGRRGLLFLYDLGSRRMRIEVGPQLEGIFTDGFVGYLIRHNLRDFFGAGDAMAGIKSTLMITLHRTREAVLGREFDTRFEEYIEDVKRLAVGGGASAAVTFGGDSAGFLNRSADSLAKAYFSPQPTVELAYQRYLEWVALGAILTDVPLLTPETQEWMHDFRVTQGYGDFMLNFEYGRAYAIDQRGGFALLYFTDDPLVSPHLFRNTKAGWQMDGIAEITSFPNLVGYPYSWFWRGANGGMGVMFADRIIAESGFERIAGGDNRQLPVRHIRWFDIGAWLYKWFPEPAPVRTPPMVEEIDVPQVADRVRASRGKTVVLAISSLHKQFRNVVFPGLVALSRQYDSSAVAFVVCSSDVPEYAWQAYWLFERYDTRIAPCWIRPWPAGQFNATVTSLGISRPGATDWMPPLVAVFDGNGSLVTWSFAVEDLAPFARAVEQTVHPTTTTLR